MSAYHATLYFTTETHSWVEAFWRLDYSFQTALAAARALASARYTILGKGCSLYRVRVTTPEQPRAVASAPVSGVPQSTTTEDAHLGVYVRLEGGSEGRHRRPYFLRGLPVGAVTGTTGPATWSPAWSTAGNAWLAMLTLGWFLQVELPLGPEIEIQGLALFGVADTDLFGNPLEPEDPPLGTPYVQAQLALGLPPGATKVLVRGAVGNPPLREVKRAINGSKKILSQDGGNIIWSGDLGPGEYVGGGLAQPQMIGYVPITRALLDRRGSRKAGPPKTADLISAAQLQTVFPGPPVLTGPPAFLAEPVGPPVPPPPPPTLELRSARDLIRQIYTSYVSPTNPEGDYIQLARVVPGPPGHVFPSDRETYLVMISGLDVHRSDSGQQLLGVIGSFTGVPDPLTPIAAELIRQNTPDDCLLVLAGDSMGGTNCEWLLNPLVNLGRRKVLSITTFGAAAVTVLNVGEVMITRFAAIFDPVPSFSPLGYWAWARLFALYEGIGGALEIANFWRHFAGAAYHIQVDAPGQPIDFFYRHTHYDINSVLDDYSWAGVYDPSRSLPPLITGPVQRFNPPLPPTPIPPPAP